MRLIFILAGMIVFLDQFVKHLIIANIPELHGVPVIGMIVRFVHVRNSGAAFSLFQGQITLFYAMTAIAVILLVVFYKQLPKKASAFTGIGLIFGGAMGNFIDRVRFGKVTDFISIIGCPTFNLADWAILTGVCLLFGVMYLQPKEKEKKEQAENISGQTTCETCQSSGIEGTGETGNVTGEDKKTQ